MTKIYKVPWPGFGDLGPVEKGLAPLFSPNKVSPFFSKKSSHPLFYLKDEQSALTMHAKSVHPSHCDLSNFKITFLHKTSPQMIRLEEFRCIDNYRTWAWGTNRYKNWDISCLMKTSSFHLGLSLIGSISLIFFRFATNDVKTKGL